MLLPTTYTSLIVSVPTPSIQVQLMELERNSGHYYSCIEAMVLLTPDMHISTTVLTPSSRHYTTYSRFIHELVRFIRRSFSTNLTWRSCTLRSLKHKDIHVVDVLQGLIISTDHRQFFQHTREDPKLSEILMLVTTILVAGLDKIYGTETVTYVLCS